MRLFSLIICLFMLSACGVVGSIKSGEAEKSLTSKADNADAYLFDTSITTSVKAGLLGDFKLKSRKISVTTTNAIVALTGTVESEEERLLAIAIAESVEGVKGVKSQIQVRTPR